MRIADFIVSADIYAIKKVLKQYSAAPEPPGRGTRLDTIVTYDCAQSISNIFSPGILNDIAMQ